MSDYNALLAILLERNDEAIRLADTKASLVAAYIGVLAGFVIDSLSDVGSIAWKSTDAGLATVATITLVAFGIGIATSLALVLLTVFPRTEPRSDGFSAFFGDMCRLKTTEDLKDRLTSDSLQSQALAEQVLSTSDIASAKFKWQTRSIVAASFTSLAWLGMLVVIVMTEW